MKLYFKAIRNYAQFNGRASRREYWIFFIINNLLAFVGIILDNLFGTTIPELGGVGYIFIIYSLLTIIPSLSVLARRLHDIDKSGWMILLSLIPIIGNIWLLFLLCTKGEDGENRYGSIPIE